MDGKTVELSIWDTAGKNMPQVVGIVYQKYADNKKKPSVVTTIGQEEFDRIRNLSYEDTHVVIICYSVDNRDSLENIPGRWVEELEEGCPQANIILVALKCDLRDDEVASKKIKPIMYEEVNIG